MTPLELSATSPELRNTTQENMERRNGSVKNVLRGMPFNRIGKPIPRPVAPENTDVIVVLSSQGKKKTKKNSPFFFQFFLIYLYDMFGRVRDMQKYMISSVF